MPYGGEYGRIFAVKIRNPGEMVPPGIGQGVVAVDVPEPVVAAPVEVAERQKPPAPAVPSSFISYLIFTFYRGDPLWAATPPIHPLRPFGERRARRIHLARDKAPPPTNQSPQRPPPRRGPSARNSYIPEVAPLVISASAYPTLSPPPVAVGMLIPLK